MKECTIEECDEFVWTLNSKLEEGSKPRYYTGRILEVNFFVDTVVVKTEKYTVRVHIQNQCALRDFQEDLKTGGRYYSIVAFDDKEYKIIMYQLPEEDWYVCHTPMIDEDVESMKKRNQEIDEEEMERLKKRQIVEGKEYYLCAVNTDEGLGYDVHASYDYIRSSNQSGKGTPVVFEKASEDNVIPAYYYIRMTGCNYSGYNYFCRSGKGWIYLNQKKYASKFLVAFERQDDVGINITDLSSRYERYFRYDYSNGKNWVISDSEYKNRGVYTLIPAAK